MGFAEHRYRTAFIALFLLLQCLVPLRYYLGGRGDDERFSWRMFSTTRLLRCDMEIAELQGMGPRAQRTLVDPRRDVQVAWVEVLRRNRSTAVARYLARRCDMSSADAVQYSRRCVQSDGARLPLQRTTLHCKGGRLVSEEVP